MVLIYITKTFSNLLEFIILKTIIIFNYLLELLINFILNDTLILTRQIL